MLNGHRKSCPVSVSVRTTPIASTKGHEMSMKSETLQNFKILSYSRMIDNFESKTMEYGQSVAFDKVNEQYFADLETCNKRYVLINLQYVILRF